MVWLPGVISIKKKTIKDDDKYKAIAYKTFFNQDVIQLILNEAEDWVNCIAYLPL